VVTLTGKRLLGKDGDRLHGLFVSVVPERDTPEVLHAYTAAFDPSFTGLYADLERIEETAKVLKVYFKKVSTGSSHTMDHFAFNYVYDPDGNLRLLLKHAQGAANYADDIRQILNPA
jgi:protein SCO1/2